MPESTENEYVQLVMERPVRDSPNEGGSRLITVSELQLVEALRLLERRGPSPPPRLEQVHD